MTNKYLRIESRNRPLSIMYSDVSTTSKGQNLNLRRLWFNPLTFIFNENYISKENLYCNNAF